MNNEERQNPGQIASKPEGIPDKFWNNDDGTVEILAQSDKPEKMAKFIQAIRKGPSRFAKVTYVDVKMVHFEDYSDFRIAN